MTPEEKLCSRTWRLRNSMGVLWSILSFGLLTGVGFLVRGAKMKNKLWIGIGIGFLIIGVGLLVASSNIDSGTKEAPIRSLAFDIWGWTWFTSFIGGVVLTFIMNRKWLIWKAHSTDTKWYAQGGNPAVSPRTSAATHNASFMGFDQNAGATALAEAAALPVERSGAQQHAQPPLDINSASIQDLQRILAVPADAAQRIVAVREHSGPFSSFEQLVAKASVQPHLLIQVRDRLTFGPGSTAGRASELRPGADRQNVRRLDL